jgi:IS5 family transposase
METFIITTYVIAEEVLRILNIQDDPQSKMSHAEVITFAILAAKFFSGNHKMARHLSKKFKFFPEILSNSRLNRRIHNISWDCWYAIFRFLSLLAKQSDDTCYFAVDSFAVSYCQKNRIDKRKCFLQSSYLGFSATKQQYFCGVKVHMVVTNKGRPVEVHMKPGAESDVSVLWSMELDIPSEALLYADGAYNCFDLEDILFSEGIRLLAKRSSKAKNRIRSQDEEKQISSKRQIVETAFSTILNQFPRYIKNRTEKGFLIKVFCFILSYSVSFLWNDSLT